jgi:hypothetical protein
MLDLLVVKVAYGQRSKLPNRLVRWRLTVTTLPSLMFSCCVTAETSNLGTRYDATGCPNQTIIPCNLAPSPKVSSKKHECGEEQHLRMLSTSFVFFNIGRPKETVQTVSRHLSTIFGHPDWAPVLQCHPLRLPARGLPSRGCLGVT